ncbi:MAG TPA: hypothetical protein PKC49_15545 [Phycisphaerae bacterium]|nr:hypothetical protein [Phycisphaerae bacterium]
MPFATAVIIGIALAAVLAAMHALFSRRDRLATAPKRSTWDWLVDGLYAAGLVLMAGTGFGAVLVYGRLSGWPLLAHAAAGGVFLPLLALSAVTWAHRCRGGDRGVPCGSSRALFWAALVLGLSAGSSIMAAMTPLAGYNVQESLYAIHRWSALGLLIVLILQCYLGVARALKKG